MTDVPIRVIYISVAVVAALSFGLLLESSWFHSFLMGHSTIRHLFLYFSSPAIMLAYVIGGHEASRPDFLMGLVAQFLAML